MADIKLCDKCGSVFNPRGAWQSLTAVTFTVRPDGLQERMDHTMELCGNCTLTPTTETNAGPLALGSGPQQVDAERDVWENPDGTFYVRRGQQQIGPFSSLKSAQSWVMSERNYGDVLDPIDGDEL